jgi:hypothetical protein
MKKFIFFPAGLSGEYLPFFINPNPISYFCLDVPLLIDNVKKHGTANVLWEQIGGPIIEIQNEATLTPTIIFNDQVQGQKITIRLKYIDKPNIFTDVEIDPFVFSLILSQFTSDSKAIPDVYDIRTLDITFPPPQFNLIESFCFNSDSEDIYIKWLNPSSDSNKIFDSTLIRRNDDGEYSVKASVDSSAFPGAYTKNNRNHKIISVYKDKLGNTFFYQGKTRRIKLDYVISGVNDLVLSRFYSDTKRVSHEYPFILRLKNQIGKSTVNNNFNSKSSRESFVYPFRATVTEQNVSSSVSNSFDSQTIRNNVTYIFIAGGITVG